MAASSVHQRVDMHMHNSVVVMILRQAVLTSAIDLQTAAAVNRAARDDMLYVFPALAGRTLRVTVDEYAVKDDAWWAWHKLAVRRIARVFRPGATTHVHLHLHLKGAWSVDEDSDNWSLARGSDLSEDMSEEDGDGDVDDVEDPNWRYIDLLGAVQARAASLVELTLTGLHCGINKYCACSPGIPWEWSFPALTTLSTNLQLVRYEDDWRDWTPSDPWLTTLLDSAPNLTRLKVTARVHMDGHGAHHLNLRTIVGYDEPRPNLRQLVIMVNDDEQGRDMPQVTCYTPWSAHWDPADDEYEGDEMNAVIEHHTLPNLEVLEMRNCVVLDPGGIFAFPALRSLTVNSIDARLMRDLLDDDEVFAISSHLKQVAFVHMPSEDDQARLRRHLSGFSRVRLVSAW